MSDQWEIGDQFPTSVMERYLARQSHGEQMVFSLTFRWNGKWDLNRLEKAWRRVLVTHVRTHSTMIGRGHATAWRVDSIKDVSKHLVIRDVPFDAGRSCIPEVSPHVRRGVGVNIVYWTSDKEDGDGQGSVLRFQFHHACCDGVGASRMVADLFKQYQRVEENDENPQAPIRSSKSLATKAAGHEVANDATSAGGLPDWRNTFATIRGKNIRLDKHSVGQKHAELFDDGRVRFQQLDQLTFELRFNYETSQAISTTLKSCRMPMNDFSVAVSIAALADVTKRFASSRHYVMVMNPVQHRTWDQRWESENHIGLAFIRRRHDDLTEPSQAIGSIHDEMESVRRLGIARELEWGMGKVERIPGGLKMMERLGWFTPTASVTCLTNFRLAGRFGFRCRRGPERSGETTGFSGLLAEEISGIGPLQAKGQLAITVLDVGDEISVAFRTSRSSENSLMPALSREVIDAVRSSWAKFAIQYKDTFPKS